MTLRVGAFVRCLAALAFLGVAATISAAQQYGRISGTVLDRHGSPVAHAKVTADYVCVKPCVKAMALDQTEADDDGYYEFKRLEYGRYSVSAEKPEEDYPPLYYPFYCPEKQPEVDVSEANKDVRQDLILRLKAGVLVGTVADSDTGTSMDATVDFAARSTRDVRSAPQDGPRQNSAYSFRPTRPC
jgi:hypothetical protein